MQILTAASTVLLFPNMVNRGRAFNPYALLKWLADDWRTYAELYSFTKVCARQVRRILNEIRDAGWTIERERAGRTYYLRVHLPEHITRKPKIGRPE